MGLQVARVEDEMRIWICIADFPQVLHLGKIGLNRILLFARPVAPVHFGKGIHLRGK